MAVKIKIDNEKMVIYVIATTKDEFLQLIDLFEILADCQTNTSLSPREFQFYDWVVIVYVEKGE